jgi:hypothetical protein
MTRFEYKAESLLHAQAAPVVRLDDPKDVITEVPVKVSGVNACPMQAIEANTRSCWKYLIFEFGEDNCLTDNSRVRILLDVSLSLLSLMENDPEIIWVGKSSCSTYIYSGDEVQL